MSTNNLITVTADEKKERIKKINVEIVELEGKVATSSDILLSDDTDTGSSRSGVNDNGVCTAMAMELKDSVDEEEIDLATALIFIKGATAAEERDRLKKKS